MGTAENVVLRVGKLIEDAGDVIGEEQPDLTTAVDRLVEGYGNLPIPYEKAGFGDELYRAYFRSGNFTPVDDTEEYFNEGGTTYLANGTVSENPPLTQWRKSLVENPDVARGGELRISSDDTTATDHRFIGYFPQYDLENKTYTYEFEFFRNFDKRHKVYFANGVFLRKDGSVVENGGCDPTIPCLALELNYSSGKVDYKLYRQSSGFVNSENIFNRKTVAFAKNALGDFVAKLKIVLSGGAIQKNVRLTEYYGTDEHVPSGVKQNYWVGDIIPIAYTIYHTVNGKNIKVAAGYIYQPANIGLVFGIGNYDALAEGQYYGIRNLTIYKGEVIQTKETWKLVLESGRVIDVEVVQPTINLSKLKSLVISEGVVARITDENGKVLWKQAPSEATITITKVGTLPPSVIGGSVTVNGTNYTEATTITVPTGTTITCDAFWVTRYMASEHTGGTIKVNGELVAESGETDAGTTTFNYTVWGNTNIEISVSYIQTSMYGGMAPAGDISITEL
jgi:hypothetical protein